MEKNINIQQALFFFKKIIPKIKKNHINQYINYGYLYYWVSHNCGNNFQSGKATTETYFNLLFRKMFLAYLFCIKDKRQFMFLCSLLI